MIIPRRLTQILQKSKKSAMLLGPRQTGKSTLIQSLSPDLTINLAHEPTFLEFARNPSELEQRLAAGNYPSVFIDEIQRLPSLLNTIQTVIDAHPQRHRFLLTGSSARKLKRGNANLLPGRIHTYHLGPLSCAELDYNVNTSQALSTGTLPGIYTDSSPQDREKTLRSYGATYLKEEIQAEALTRNLEGFSRFLFLAAECSGQWLDLSKLASEAAIPRQSAIRYFEILEDTLIVNRCNAFSKSNRMRLVQHPKYYFFDTGVLNGLFANFTPSADRKGILFEHLFFNQLMTSAAAQDIELRVTLYRTEHGAEVDFILELGHNIWAIELKASQNVGTSDLRGFASFERFYNKPHRQCVAYMGTAKKKINSVEIFPWQELLKEIGL
jgi:predicted AAA+ superfamily ATPase